MAPTPITDPSLLWEIFHSIATAVFLVVVGVLTIARPWYRDRTFKLLSADKGKHADFIFDVLERNPGRHKAIIAAQWKEEIDMTRAAREEQTVVMRNLSESIRNLTTATESINTSILAVDKKVTRVARKMDRTEGWLAAQSGKPIPTDEDDQ